MQFEYDPEKLIEEVKKRPGLWDFECMDYRVKHVRQTLWSEIVRELNSNTAQASKSELRVLDLQLQKKWKSIRDCYQKYLVNPKKSKRPYIYAKQLCFLTKRSELHDRTEEASSDSDQERKGKWVVKKMARISKVPSDDEPEHLQVSNHTDDFHSEEEIVNDTNNTNNSRDHFSATQFAFANVDTVIKNDENDPERLFLLSLLPHLKKVPEDYKLNVKMELMAVLQNAQYSRDCKNML